MLTQNEYVIILHLVDTLITLELINEMGEENDDFSPSFISLVRYWERDRGRRKEARVSTSSKENNKPS